MNNMSKMSELVLDIGYLLKEGRTPMDVARELEIPVSWVYEAQEMDEDSEEILSPFATINS
jgi:hypothetical protein